MSNELDNRDKTKFYEPQISNISVNDDMAQKYEYFERWLLQNSSKFPHLEIKEYDEENEVRGVHAKVDIESETLIAEIPLNCLITVEMGMETPIGKLVKQSGVDLDAPKHVYLMLFILTDMKNPDSFFRPYYDLLPKSLSNMPIFWTEEELKWLEGSELLNQIQDRKQIIEDNYETICQICPEFAEIASLHDFSWARMCVCSRNFGIEINGRSTSALVPFADMLNHYRPQETKWMFDGSLNAFTITSTQIISAGSQVYDSYGVKCNHRFLLNYGFSIENNIEPGDYCPNEVAIEISLDPSDPSDPLFLRKKKLFSKSGVLCSHKLRLSANYNENFRYLFSLLRVSVADETSLHILETEYFPRQRSYSSITRENEKMALLKLIKIIEMYLSGYLTSLEEDLELLRSGELKPFSNHRHAVIQTKNEKQVFAFYQDLTLTSINLLEQSDASIFDEELQNAINRDRRFSNYFWDTLSPLYHSN